MRSKGDDGFDEGRGGDGEDSCRDLGWRRRERVDVLKKSETKDDVDV